MKAGVALFLIAAGVSFIVGLYSRFTMQPLPITPGGIGANALLIFTNTCLLLAVISLLFQKGK